MHREYWRSLATGERNVNTVAIVAVPNERDATLNGVLCKGLVCVDLGRETGEQIQCGGCMDGVRFKVFHCHRFRDDTVAGRYPIDGKRWCGSCNERSNQIRPNGVEPTRLLTVDSQRLEGGRTKYNASWIAWRKGALLAYRCGEEASSIGIAGLDVRGQIQWSKLIAFRGRRFANGVEDPRLFRLGTKIYLSFSFRGDHDELSSIAYAELDESFGAKKFYVPSYRNRTPCEKNWVFFGANGRLFCVYQSGREHRVLRIDGNRVTAEYVTDNQREWFGGYIRGGASPIRIGETFFSWFHGQKIGVDGTAYYSIGVQVFEAKPPFRVTKQTVVPIYNAPEDDRVDPVGGKPYVIFPGGAIFERGQWLVSCGVNDRQIRILKFPHGKVRSLSYSSLGAACVLPVTSSAS